MRTGTTKNGSSTLLSFLLGGVVGAVVGALIAPQSGSETRRRLKMAATETKNNMNAVLGKSRNFYSNTRIAMASAVQAGKQAYLQEREKFQIAGREDQTFNH